MKVLKVLLVLVVLMLPVMVQAQTSVGTLVWSANSESDLSGYKVYRALVPCQIGVPIPAPALKDVGKVTTFTDTTIPLGTVDVCYAVTAYDILLNESPQSLKVGKKFVVVVPLPSPTNFKYVLGSFVWDVVPGAKGYSIFVHENGTLYIPCTGMTYCNTTGTLITNSLKLVLKPGTTYDAWVQAVDVNGLVGVSQGYSLTTPIVDVIPPLPPVGLIISLATPDKIIITAMHVDCPNGVVTSQLLTMGSNMIGVECKR